jgi:hypothetical protein
VEGVLHNNCPTKGSEILAYIYLTQYYEEQTIKKNKIRNGLTVRKTSNSEHNSVYHKITGRLLGARTKYYRIFTLTQKYYTLILEF